MDERLQTDRSPDGAPTRELVRRIVQDARSLARDEVALAKLELANSLKYAGAETAALTLGGVLSLISLGLLCMTMVAALAPLIPALWLRMLLMSGVYLCIGALFTGIFGLRLRGRRWGAPQARDEAKETLSALTEHVRHG